MRGARGTQPLQRWTTKKGLNKLGEASEGNLNQPLTGQLDAASFTELAAMLEVTSFVASTPANLSLIVETAESVDSPAAAWEEIISTSAVTVAHAYASARSDATKHLLRWVRWRINVGDSGDWSITYRVCVTLR